MKVEKGHQLEEEWNGEAPHVHFDLPNRLNAVADPVKRVDCLVGRQ